MSYKEYEIPNMDKVELETELCDATIRSGGLTTIETALCEVIIRPKDAETVPHKVSEDWQDIGPKQRSSLAIESVEESICEIRRCIEF